MSVGFFINCDGEDCGQDIFGDIGRSLEDVRAEWAKAGWVAPYGKDFCPWCVADSKHTDAT